METTQQPVMRAKLKVETVTRTEYGEQIDLSAVCGKTNEKGVDEDNTFSKYAPTASLKLQVTNPNVFGFFNPGDKFYLDFTPAPES